MRVLIADDDPAALLLLESLLKDWGYTVTTARDGIEAWEVLRRADSPALAILDWMMPDLDGVDVCRKVRQEGEAPFVYLVLLTRKAATQDVVQGMESGADDYVSKPFDEQEWRLGHSNRLPPMLVRGRDTRRPGRCRRRWAKRSFQLLAQSSPRETAPGPHGVFQKSGL